MLIVVIDDYLPFCTEEDKEVLERFAKSVIEDKNPDFKGVVLLGSTGNYLVWVRGQI